MSMCSREFYRVVVAIEWPKYAVILGIEKGCCSTGSGKSFDFNYQLGHDLFHSDALCHHNKTDTRRWNTGCRGSTVKSGNLSSSESIKSSCQNSSSSRGRSPPTTMPIRPQQPNHTSQSSLPPSAMTSIDDAPFCRFCLASSLSITRGRR